MKFGIEDVQIDYEVQGTGTPIVMIHGWGCDRGLMKGCMEPLFRDGPPVWQRIYFDLPGMGATEGRPWIDGSDRMLDLIQRFLDGIIPGRKFLLAGESYGGYLARGLVHRWASRVDGLLLICPSFRPWIVTENGFDKGDLPEPVVLEKDEELLSSLADEDRYFF